MKYIVNITSGIQIINLVPTVHGFCRIQSTLCEQKNWSRLIEDLDWNVLVWLASGEKVKIIDCSNHGWGSRACWQGVEFIKFCLEKNWFGKANKVFFKLNNSTNYCENQYYKLSKRAMAKIKSARRLLNPSLKCVNLLWICRKTEREMTSGEICNELVEWSGKKKNIFLR